MTSTWVSLAQGVTGVLAFALLFVPGGYVLADILRVAGFRTLSVEEKTLWSVCLSVPLTLTICSGVGRILPAGAVLLLLVLLAFCAAILGCWPQREWIDAGDLTSPSRVALLLVLIVGIYIPLALTDIGFGQHLYVSAVLYDWSVRVPMVAAAMRSGVPPVNGLGSIGGHPAALRYFYYWYVVCADLARLARIPARASLTASCVWSAWALLAAFFLMLKYMVGITRNLREHCVAAFAVLAVMGLDLIPTLPLLLVRKLHPYAEIEWWHQDRTPSVLSACLYAPHHLAAFACLLTGLLLVRLTMEESEVRLSPWIAGLLAGLCFAAAAGTSILPTFVVAIACVVWAVDLAWQKQFQAVGVLAGSAVVALLLARSFLHELATTDSAGSGAFASVRFRNWDFVRMYQGKYHVVTHHAWLDLGIAVAGVVAIHLLDLGFYLFVLIHQVRRDRSRRLTVGERAIWALFAGTAIPYLFLSSASIASPNDLGVDAGLLLRLLMQVWAVAWVYGLWTAWRRGEKPFAGSRMRSAGLALAGCCFVLGLAGEALQVVWERLYLPLVGSQTLAKQLDVLTTDRLSERLYNIREAYRLLDRTPNAEAASAAIQYNPIGPMQPALTFYATHQIAAFDIGCGTGYGGSLAACRAVMPGLLRLYGNTEAGSARGKAANDRQDGAADQIAGKAEAEAACRELHVWALVAESTDSIWGRPGSWVWTMEPVVANSTVRIFRCPGRPGGGA